MVSAEGDSRPSLNLRRHSTGGALSFGDTADLCSETDDVPELIVTDASKHTKVVIAGGLAGSIGKTFTAPLSRLTILFQVHSLVSTTHTSAFSDSMSGALRKVVSREGLLALWKGNGTSVIHRFPYSAMNFLAYESVKCELSSRYDEAHPALVRFISGATAGATATISCYPLDLIRTRLATQLDARIHYRGISHAFYRILSEEGIAGLFRGIGTTLCVTIPNMAINFTIYETLKEKYRLYKGLEEEDHLPVKDTLVCGAIAGTLSSISTFPIDVIRRRMQISGMYCSDGVRRNAATLAKQLLSEQGVRGFYRGLAPELLKVIPMVSITFGSFERIKRLLEVPP